MLTGTIIYIVGPPGVGQYTVGRLLADRLGCKLVDNHYWLNVVFSLVEQSGGLPRGPRKGRKGGATGADFSFASSDFKTLGPFPASF